MSIKKHLQGGTLRKVMVNEVKRCLKLYVGQPQSIEKAAIHLGVTPKTLRLWKGPVDKGGWEELQIPAGAAVEALMAAGGIKPKKVKSEQKQ